VVLFPVAIGFNSRDPTDNIIAPKRSCGYTDAPLLHCGTLDEPLARPWF
jgi:hypothetical protein